MSFMYRLPNGNIPNMDPETGIHYGVISLNSLADWVIDEIFTNGENLSWLDAQDEAKKDFEREAQKILYAGESLDPDGYVEEKLEQWNAGYEENEDIYRLETEDEGGEKIIVQTTESGLFVFMSPVIVNTRLCSPCYPNAGDLDNLDPDGVETYGLPKNWVCGSDND